MELPFSTILVPLILLVVQMMTTQTDAQNRSAALVPAVLVFGDSIADTGNNNNLHTLIKANFPPYGRDFVAQIPTGRFCNGKIPSDLIASALGVKEILPSYLGQELNAQDLLTGVSFASAASGYDPLTSKIVSVLSLSDQIELFKEYTERLKVVAGEDKAFNIVNNSLYIVFAGSDDLANTYFSTPFRRSHFDVPSYIHLLVTSASSFYQELYNFGARKIGVVGIPPIGCLPSQRTLGGGKERECVASFNEAAVMLNSRLSQELSRLNDELPGSVIVFIDIYTYLLNIIQFPSDYGIYSCSLDTCDAWMWQCSKT